MTDKLYSSTHDKITKLEDSLRQATIHYEEAELQVDRFFAEMRRILTAEEDGLKAKIKEMMLGFEGKCREREGKLNDQLDNLQQLVEVVTQGGNAENVEFLQTIKDRDELMEKIMNETEDLPTYTQISYTKSQLCDVVAKQIDKLKAKDLK
jgi:hypothetical protein